VAPYLSIMNEPIKVDIILKVNNKKMTTPTIASEVVSIAWIKPMGPMDI